MSEANEPVLSLENVAVEFEDESALMEVVPDSVKQRFGWDSMPLRAVDDVSLEVGENDVVAIIGESGSGKTTLGKTAVGLQEPTTGTVKYRDQDIWELKRKNRIDGQRFADVRRSLQIIHQDPGAALNPFRTLISILKKPLRRWYPELTHADCRERILEIFRVIGLTPAEDYLERYPHELSGGEQQRVALVRAVLVEPDLILADEPVSALDPSLRLSLMDLMLELQELFEISFVFISHNIQHARYITSQVGGRIAVMYLGNIVEIGPVEEVIQNPKHPYTRVLLWATLSRHPDVAKSKLQEDPPLRTVDSPDIANPPSGCRFHTRCPKAREACATTVPELGADEVGTHRVACFRDDSNHEYWSSGFLDDDGEIEIPD